MAVEFEESTTETGAVRSSLRDARSSIVSVFRNPSLRRIQLALAGSMIGDWAYSTAVIVWAYGVGGAKAVGVWGAIRFVLMAIASPLGSALADRLPRKAVMVAADLARAVAVVAATLCLWAAHAGLAGLRRWRRRPRRSAASSGRPRWRWLPSLTDRPEELTAANGTAEHHREPRLLRRPGASAPRCWP